MPRVLLWSKLLSNNINGKILDVICNMYASAKSFVRNNDVNGELFTCGIGVRHGENVSPLLFALYINDLNELIEKSFNGLHTISKYIEEFNDTDDTVLYLKLLILLYADDTCRIQSRIASCFKWFKSLLQNMETECIKHKSGHICQ